MLKEKVVMVLVQIQALLEMEIRVILALVEMELRVILVDLEEVEEAGVVDQLLQEHLQTQELEGSKALELQRPMVVQVGLLVLEEM
jgi:hypothetical protein